MLYALHPTHCLSQVYLVGLTFEVVLTWGDEVVSLETHLVLGLPTGALITFPSFNKWDAFFHMGFLEGYGLWRYMVLINFHQ